MAISDKLNYLIETKSKFKDRLNSLGAEIIESTTFRNYLNWLDNFYIGSANKTELSKNGVVGRTSQNPTLPTDYTRVDYIESSGMQYIDTGVKANQDTITDTTLEINNFTEDYNAYFGSCYQFSSQAYELMSVYRPNYGIDPSITNTYNDGYVFTDTISTNTKYNIRKEKNVAYLDGNIIANQEYAEFETPVNMYIFATNSNGNANYKSSIRLYKMTISDGTNMLRNFIPCYRNSDNAVGLYDLVNDVFYTNQGTGVFTYGNIILEPSPDYPLEIKNLSGDVEYKVRGQGISEIFPLSLKSKNLFDYKTPNIKQVTWTPTDNGGLFTSSTHWRNLGNRLELDTTKQYTFSFGARNSTNLYYYIKTYTDETYNTVKTTIVNDGTALSKTFAPDSNYVSIYFANGGNLRNVEIPNIQLEESPTKTDFEPYYDIELCKIGTYQDKIAKSKGKNLFNKKITPENYFYNASGERTYDSNYLYINQTIENINYDSITISFHSKIGYANVRVCEYNSSGTFISRTLVDTNNQVVNLDNATAKIILSVNSDSNAYFNCLMINEGNTALPYEPYGKVWYLNKQIGKVVLNGSEEWKIGGTYSEITQFDVNANTTNIPETILKVLSNYFRGVVWKNSWTINKCISIGLNIIRIMTSDYTTVADFKTWLSTHNTIVYYVLATPTTEEITQENYPTLYSQLLAIQEFLTKYKINNEFLLDYSSPEIEY